MYESPIKMLEKSVKHKIENDIFQCVIETGVMVANKDELLKALAYDRDQYKKGYQDAMDSIVRCKNCEHYGDGSFCYHPSQKYLVVTPEHYCGLGDRKGGADNDNKRQVNNAANAWQD